MPSVVKVVDPITCQGIFTWNGELKRLKEIGLLAYRRSRKIFYALNVPNLKKLNERELANLIIMDAYVDEGLESPFVITDPQKVYGGFMKPYEESFQTDNPGMMVFVGFVMVPGYQRFTEPGEHNIRIKYAFKDIDASQRIFDAEHGAGEYKATFKVINDYKPD